MTKSSGPRPAHCRADDCDLPANVPGTAKGFCSKHYARLYKYGDHTATRIGVDYDPVCSVDDCGRRHCSRGMCQHHYNQWWAMQQRLSGKRCAIDGCTNVVKCKGLCGTHYSRKRKGTRMDKPIRSQLPSDCSYCPDCDQVLPKTAFSKSADRPDGTFVYCKACWSERTRTKYRTTVYAQQKRWRDANPERVAASLRRWAQANPEKVRAKHARQRAADPERYRRYAHTGDMNRRGRERNAPGFATTAQIMARWEYFGDRCWMCGEAATETDHVKPLAKGGSQWPSNMRPACRPCNGRKLARWPVPLTVVRKPAGEAGPAGDSATRRKAADRRIAKSGQRPRVRGSGPEQQDNLLFAVVPGVHPERPARKPARRRPHREDAQAQLF